MDLEQGCISAIMKSISLLIVLALLISCDTGGSSRTVPRTETNGTHDSPTVVGNIPLPAGYRRMAAGSGSFANYLRSVPLKQSKLVHLFNGELKRNQQAQYAVLDIAVGDKNLQQCADAVMRLRAEYLYSERKYGEIVFRDNNNTVYNFGNAAGRLQFENYLEKVFGMCGTASLSKQLHAVTDFTGIKAGDVLIRGGFPGHAVIVMDVAVNDTGEKIYLLAQSYMPAQEIHILKNPVDHILSPWYAVNDDPVVATPEYRFMQHELKEW